MFREPRGHTNFMQGNRSVSTVNFDCVYFEPPSAFSKTCFFKMKRFFWKTNMNLNGQSLCQSGMRSSFVMMLNRKVGSVREAVPQHLK